MAFDSIKFKESENIIPFCLENKERYYHDLINIENSWTSRLDAMYSNEFFREAIQLIINSIVLFKRDILIALLLIKTVNGNINNNYLLCRQL